MNSCYLFRVNTNIIAEWRVLKLILEQFLFGCEWESLEISK
jgi:hypothetical protein